MDDALAGTWTITALLPSGTATQAQITFEDGHLHFYAGCNRAMGSYTFDGRTLMTGPVALTMMYCPDMTAEDHLCRALAAPLDISFEGDALVATGESGGFAARRA